MQTIPATHAAPLVRRATDIRQWARLVWDWRLALLLTLLALLLTLAAQLPLQQTIHLGSDDGLDRANAFVFDFYPAEQQGDLAFRWSTDHGRLVFPGVGAQPLGVQFDVLAHRAQFIDQNNPTPLHLTVNGQPIDFRLRREAAHYHILVPKDWMGSGTLDMIVSTPAWQPAADSRTELGVAIGEFTITGLGTPGTRGAYWPVLASWLLVLLLCWPVGRLVGFSPNGTLVLLLSLLLVPVLTTAGAPSYLALGNRALIIATAWGVVLALLLHFGLPPLLSRLAIRNDPTLVRWLILTIVVSFVLKYGGRLYPGSMYGDLDLHWHRFIRMIGGSVYIMAAHRGLPFPFPGALYIVTAPFSLLGIPTWVAFEFGAAVFEATTPLLIALIATRTLGSLRIGVVGGAIYATMASGFMTTWFAFETHIFAQWATLLLWTLLLFCWPHTSTESPLRRPLLWSVVVLVQCWVYLGHTGFLINAVTLFAIGLPLLLWATWRGPQRQAALQITVVILLGGLIAAAIYYTAFVGLILTQLQGIAQVGLLEVTGRRPVTTSETLRHLWEDGILVHYGLFPLPLALCGLALLAQRRKAEDRGPRTHERKSPVLHLASSVSSLRSSVLLLWLIILTFLVSLVQAVLPLFTRSTLTTRYLTFAAWAIAIAAAPMLLRLWRRGPAGKLVVLLMAAFVGWGTLVLWAGALALNIAPTEPF